MKMQLYWRGHSPPSHTPTIATSPTTTARATKNALESWRPNPLVSLAQRPFAQIPTPSRIICVRSALQLCESMPLWGMALAKRAPRPRRNDSPVLVLTVDQRLVVERSNFIKFDSKRESPESNTPLSLDASHVAVTPL